MYFYLLMIIKDTAFISLKHKLLSPYLSISTSSSCYQIVGLGSKCFTLNSVELFATLKKVDNFDLRRPLP